MTAIAPTTLTETWAISRTRRADEIVLATHALTPGTDETSLSRFVDDQWDLAPAIFRENVPRCLMTVDFASLEDPWQRLTAKEFIWARMNEASPLPTQARLAPTMARATLYMLSGFMAFVADHAGRFAMHLVDQALLDAYLAELKRQPGRTLGRIAHIVDVPIMLDRHGRFLTLGSFSCRPWRGRPAVRIAGVAPRPMTAENRTRRIPEPLISAMLRWSLRYIDDFSQDIFAARAELDRLEQTREARNEARRGIALSDRLDIYIGRRCVEGRGIPKHASVAIFEGYAGSSPSGFRIEVEQERALGQLDDVVAYYEDAVRHGLPPAGPAAARLRREFEHIRDELGDLPGRIVDSQRLRAMLAHLGRTLHVGLLADCFFDPDTALCLDREEAPVERSAPALSHCRPDRCPNACITRRHLAPWHASIAEGERMLGERRLSPLQQQALLQDSERKRHLIAPLMEGDA